MHLKTAHRISFKGRSLVTQRLDVALARNPDNTFDLFVSGVVWRKLSYEDLRTLHIPQVPVTNLLPGYI